MMHVGAGAVTGDFGENSGAPGGSVIESLEGHHGGTFAEGESVAIGVKGSGQIGAQRLQGVKAGEYQLTKCVVAAGQSALAFTRLQLLVSVTDGIGTGRAGVGDDGNRAVDIEGIGEVGSLGLGLIHVNPTGLSTRIIGRGDGLFVVFFTKSHRSGRGAEGDRDLFPVGILGGPAALCDRFAGGVNQHRRSAVEAGSLSRREFVADGKLFGQVELTGPVHALAAGIKQADIAKCQSSGAETVGIFPPAEAHRSDDAGSGDDDSLRFCTGRCFRKGQWE